MKAYKIFLLLFCIFNTLYAKSLNVVIINNSYENSLKESIVEETNKLFLENENIVFTQEISRNKEEFFSLFKTLEKNKNLDVIIILGENNASYINEAKNIDKTTILISSNSFTKTALNKSSNFSFIDYSSFKKDMSFIKDNFSTSKLYVLSKEVDLKLRAKFLNYDFVYISSLFLKEKNEVNSLLMYLNKHKIKTFYAGESKTFLNKTLFSNKKKSLLKISRTVAIQLYEVLKEEEKLEKHIKIYSSSKINFNKELAKQISFDISFNLLFKVTKINDTFKENKVLDLKQALALVLQNSYDYKMALNNLRLSKLGISTAYSSYKPNLGANLSYTLIDADRAKYSGGQYNERSLYAGITYSQLLYSSLSYKNIDISKKLYSSNKSELSLIKEKLLYLVVLKYLNTLNIKESFEIVKSKKAFIVNNLLLAKNRLEVGFSDKSDIYRWQSELALVNISLVNIKTSFNKSKIELSSFLQIPDKQNISLVKYSKDDELFKLFNKTPALLIKKPKDLEKFSTYLSSTFIKKHSLIKKYEELIKAKKFQIQAYKSSKYLPTLSFNANAMKLLDKKGEGSSTEVLWDDKQYTAQINMKIPLYEGGKKNISIQKNKIELMNLYNLLNKQKLNLKEDILKNIQNISSSYNTIKYSSQAYLSAKKNYMLIQDKYAKGKTNILSLLDAQNSMIISKMQNNSSNYAYLLDISTIFYTIGYIDILHNKQEKEKLQNELKEVL